MADSGLDVSHHKQRQNCLFYLGRCVAQVSFGVNVLYMKYNQVTITSKVDYKWPPMHISYLHVSLCLMWKPGTFIYNHVTFKPLPFLYLGNGLLHLRLSEGGECSFQIVHDALEAVTLHYLPLVAAQQTEGHFKDHLSPLDK